MALSLKIRQLLKDLKKLNEKLHFRNITSVAEERQSRDKSEKST